MIVFDSNQLRRVLPGSPTLVMLKAAASQSGHTLATTDLVLREIVRQRREELQLRIKQVWSAQKEFNKLVRPESHVKDMLSSVGIRPYMTHPEEKEVEHFETELRAEFQILETAPDDAREALWREADHRVPCKMNGEGGRDTAIFLTAVRAADHPDLDADGHPLPVIFVTEDRAFSATKDGTRFANELLHDLRQRNVLLRPDVVSVLAKLGYPHSWIDSAEIINREDFCTALQDALISAAAEALPSYMLTGLAEAEIETPRQAQGGGKALQCRGGDFTMTTVVGRWVMNVITGQLTPQEQSLYRAYHRGFLLNAQGTALVLQNNAGDVIEAQFSPLALTTS
ncbi:PIN domain-containing protein [Streptomyces sp. NPDC015184]|uniref:PIN domain-containing protein n=1 Tax=Streptomyces sp. NPDC015184 TaxID=3364946 RepID=UPI003701FDAC